MTPLRIGTANLPNILLAPLSGCSDLAFRLIARECGAEFCFFEMIDAHALLYPNPRKFDVLQTLPQDVPIGAQLLGADPGRMLDAAHVLLSKVKIDVLDINSACPVKKVVKKGAGAKLATNPKQLGRAVRILASYLDVPVTVKLRAGYNNINLSALIRLVKGCEDNGAAAIFIHGRTRAQGYSGTVDYAPIRAVKAAVSIPVIGSGDVLTPQLAKLMLDETGCDGVLVARGAFGNPWLLQDIDTYLRTGMLPPQRTISTRKTVLLRHLQYQEQYNTHSPSGKVGIMRKVTLWYLKGFPGASKLRGQISTIPNYEALVRFIEQQL